MPKSKKDCVLHFTASQELRQRLDHHSKRLGMTRTNIIREGILLRLAQLDEEERVTVENQQKRFSLIAERKKLLGRREAIASSARRTTTPIPEKFEESFRRYADFLEAYTSPEDKARRAQEILEDIKDRCDSVDEEKRVHAALTEFLSSRKRAQEQARGTPAARLMDALKSA